MDLHSRRVVVIGGGQSGLATGDFLRRAGPDFEILDTADGPGGAWQPLCPHRAASGLKRRFAASQT
jgi:putative flavoprotein involved in K+ transport